MTDLEKAARQALEVLKSSRVFVTTREKIKHPEGTEAYDEIVEALRQALEQPKQEPVKYWRLAPLTGYYDVGGKRVWLEKDEPFPEQPTDPKRKPLTDAQINNVAADIWGSALIAPQSCQLFARAIEAAHGIGEQ